MDRLLIQPKRQPKISIFILLGLITVAWFTAYNLLQPLANWITYSLLQIRAGTHLGTR